MTGAGNLCSRSVKREHTCDVLGQVYNVETWKANAEKAARRRAARDRFLDARKAARAAHAPPSEDTSLRRRCVRWLPWRSCLPCLPVRQPPQEEQPAAKPPAGQDAAGGERPASVDKGSPLSRSGASGRGWSAKRGAGSRTAARRLVRVDSLADDADFDEYCGWWIDRAALCVLFVGYVVTASLIFALSSGYIDLFSQP